MEAAWGEVITRSLFHVPAARMPSSSVRNISRNEATVEVFLVHTVVRLDNKRTANAMMEGLDLVPSPRAPPGEKQLRSWGLGTRLEEIRVRVPGLAMCDVTLL